MSLSVYDLHRYSKSDLQKLTKEYYIDDINKLRIIALNLLDIYSLLRRNDSNLIKENVFTQTAELSDNDLVQQYNELTTFRVDRATALLVVLAFRYKIREAMWLLGFHSPDVDIWIQLLTDRMYDEEQDMTVSFADDNPQLFFDYICGIAPYDVPPPIYSDDSLSRGNKIIPFDTIGKMEKVKESIAPGPDDEYLTEGIRWLNDKINAESRKGQSITLPNFIKVIVETFDPESILNLYYTSPEFRSTFNSQQVLDILVRRFNVDHITSFEDFIDTVRDQLIFKDCMRKVGDEQECNVQVLAMLFRKGNITKLERYLKTDFRVRGSEDYKLLSRAVGKSDNPNAYRLFKNKIINNSRVSSRDADTEILVGTLSTTPQRLDDWVSLMGKTFSEVDFNMERFIEGVIDANDQLSKYMDERMFKEYSDIIARVAAENNNVRLFYDSGEKMNEQYLYAAIRGGSITLVEDALKDGIRFNTSTALNTAMDNNQVTILKLLLDYLYKSDRRSDISAIQNAIIRAGRGNNIEVIEAFEDRSGKENVRLVLSENFDKLSDVVREYLYT